ncbi:MAG: phage tail protein [Deltaproteobacteria bacterium]|nr:phage tail protein [Deltaproteobacteria bacterium]MCP5007172.1 phage tail protein [Planctomycetota bacterium]
MSQLMHGQQQDTQDKGIMGVAIAVVTNNKDKGGVGRVKVKYPWREDEDESYWARIATPMAGNEMGLYLLPEVGQEVLVAFKNGDINYPYILGALWSKNKKPPETNDDGKNNIRLIKSRSGHKVVLDDTDGSEKIEIIDKSGSNHITIDTAQNTIEIKSNQDIKLSASNGTISLDAMEIEIKSSANTKIEAGANADLKATGNTTVKGAMVMIN